MAIKTRSDLQSGAENTNIPDNTIQDIEPIDVRNQYQDERDSTINQLDDGVSPKSVNAKKFLTYSIAPPTVAELTNNDIPCLANVNELLASSGGLTRAIVNTEIINNASDDGITLISGANSSIYVEQGSPVNVFHVKAEQGQQLTIQPNVATTLQDASGNVIAAWQSNLVPKIATVFKVDASTYRIIEEVEGGGARVEDLVFHINSNAPTSLTVDSLKGIASVEEVTLSPKLASNTFITREGGTGAYTTRTLTELNTYLGTLATSAIFELGVVGVYGVGITGDATARLKLKYS